MSTPSSKKRPAGDNSGHGDEEIARVAMPATKRPRPRSISSTEHLPQLALDSSIKLNRLSSGHDLDRLNYHVRLQDFGVELQKAANAVFPGGQSSRYKQVDAILLSWEDEDPELPVSLEIGELSDTLANLYGYHVEEWLIPSEESHNRLQVKILQFLWNSNPSHLKIVYYTGYEKLTKKGQPVWTSRRNSQRERCPTVKWSGIQNSLEESQSDVLILLDCNASGVCTTEEGNGVAELIAACASNTSTSGESTTGPFSFTHVLNTQLKLLSQLPCFTIGQLYNAIFAEVQGWKLEDPSHKKAPVHLLLNHNHGSPRSICLSKCLKTSQTPDGSLANSDPRQSDSAVFNFQSPEESKTPSSTGIFAPNLSAPSSTTSLSPPPEYPRLLFSIRISEDVQPSDFSPDLFLNWLKTVPIQTSLIRVEAGFASDSTLVLFSISPTVLAYLPSHPALTLLGTIKSKNIMPNHPPVLPLRREPLTSGEMRPPPTPFSTKKRDDPSPPKGGCRYVLLHPDIHPLTCACQAFTPSQDTTLPSSTTICDCGHKPCYHLATRSYTVYRQEVDALTKKVYILEQDVRRIRIRGSGRGLRLDERDE